MGSTALYLQWVAMMDYRYLTLFFLISLALTGVIGGKIFMKHADSSQRIKRGLTAPGPSLAFLRTRVSTANGLALGQQRQRQHQQQNDFVVPQEIASCVPTNGACTMERVLAHF